MNNLKYVLLIMPFIYISAQQLDETYLDSLPDDIKEDLLERADQNMEDAESNYRSSLYSSKLEKAEELIKLKTRLEKDLEELERRL